MIERPESLINKKDLPVVGVLLIISAFEGIEGFLRRSFTGEKRREWWEYNLSKTDETSPNSLAIMPRDERKFVIMGDAAHYNSNLE